jgi:L-aspartate oxidase
VQFHPTVLSVPGAPRTLLSEAIRGEGAWLINTSGERFMLREEPAGELASRDVVARAMVREMARTGGRVFLTLQHLDAESVTARFPTAAAACRSAGLNLARDRIPVSPAAHYEMGGVETDTFGRTTVPGLFAAGEVACTGVHGANRLASNSLLEGLVFGARAARAMLEPPRTGAMANVREISSQKEGSALRTSVPSETEVRDLMWRHVGLTRECAGLETAVQRLSVWRDQIETTLAAKAIEESGWRLASLITVGALIASAALRRQETRGGHYRTDFPARDDVNWKFHIADRRPSVCS